MLTHYKKFHQLNQIRDIFKRNYPAQEEFFSVEALRSEFFKILRLSLRKVAIFCDKYGKNRVPTLVKLNDTHIKYILRSPNALKSRQLLVDNYLLEECNIPKLYETVTTIN